MQDHSSNVALFFGLHFQSVGHKIHALSRSLGPRCAIGTVVRLLVEPLVKNGQFFACVPLMVRASEFEPSIFVCGGSSGAGTQI